jgi:NitT/TauT family transport system ATP-binding protein
MAVRTINNINNGMETPLCRLDGVTKTYPRPDSGGSFTVLDNVSFKIGKHEIVALLGRSGSGKSTILRSVAGLIQVSSGSITSSGRPVTGPNTDVAMVFQSFALLPWLSVLDNVMIGLESQHLSADKALARAEEALRLVGLDGFENAYPRELSGGMQQRVGFARAFVVRPKLLLLDEPFSALDVLTAENLRGEIADLWEEGNFPAESVLLVTHNIEEAILLADRVVILSSNPGRVRGEISIGLSRPRQRGATEFKVLVDHIYTIMTNPDTQIGPLGQTGTKALGEESFRPDAMPLPHARPGAISGLLELIEEYGGPQDVAVISERLRIASDDLLPILDAAVLLGFAEVKQGDATLTEIGKVFVNADVDEEKDIFRHQALENAPMVRTMYEALVAAHGKPMREDFFLDILDENFSAAEAREQFETAVNWGRYAGLIEYDSTEGELRLAEEEE